MSPINRMLAAEGPMKAIPHCSQTSAKCGFSARKPYPGWMAWAPLTSAELMIRSSFR